MLAINAIFISAIAIGLIFLLHKSSNKIEFLFYTICMFAFEIGAAKLLLNFNSALAIALMLTCIMSPCVEETVRSLGRNKSEMGGFNVNSISLSIGGVEAVIKAVRFYFVVDALAYHSPLFFVTISLTSIISIIFHINMGFLWNHLAKTRRVSVVTLECFLAHAAYNASIAIIGIFSASLSVYFTIVIAIANLIVLAGCAIYSASPRRGADFKK